MDFGSGIILGAIQGITEFLPVSSSGHLILIRDFMGINTSNGLAFDAVLQLATSLAVFTFFRRDFLRIIRPIFNWGNSDKKDKNFLLAVIIGTIPAIVFGLLFETYMETIFRNSSLVAYTLIAGSILFVIAEKVSTRQLALRSLDEGGEINKKKGLFIGFFQALAILPGMSRSGSAISGGLLFGLNREEAIRFSFMLGFPVLFGGGIKKLIDLGTTGLLDDIGLTLLFSSIVAFVVGFSAMKFMMKYLKDNRLYMFAIYRVLLALIIFFLI